MNSNLMEGQREFDLLNSSAMQSLLMRLTTVSSGEDNMHSKVSLWELPDQKKNESVVLLPVTAVIREAVRKCH